MLAREWGDVSIEDVDGDIGKDARVESVNGFVVPEKAVVHIELEANYI